MGGLLAERKDIAGGKINLVFHYYLAGVVVHFSAIGPQTRASARAI